MQNKLLLKRNLLLIMLVMLVMHTFQSCTISKRVHRKGYHVSWQKSNFRTPSNLVIDSIDNVSNKVDLTAEEISIRKKESNKLITHVPLRDSKLQRKSIQYKRVPNLSSEHFFRSTHSKIIRNETTSHSRDSRDNEEGEEESEFDRLKTGKLMVFIGIGAFLLLGSIGASSATGVALGILSLIAFIAIIWGIVFWIQGRRKQKAKEGRKERSEESKRFLRLSLLFLLLGITLALGTAATFALTEPVAASTANVVTEVTTIVFGVVAGYILLGLTILSFFVSIVFLLKALMADS